MTDAPAGNLPDGCQKCQLYESCSSPFMDGEGQAKSPALAVVGDFPSDRDDSAGLPFQSRAGTLLRDTLQEMGIQSDEVYFTNAVRCRPQENKVGARQMQACRPLLWDELHGLRPKAILALGGVALESMTGRKGILASRGQVFDYTMADGSVIPLVASNHPSYVLFQESTLDQFIGDVQKAVDICRNGRKTDVAVPKRYRVVRTREDAFDCKVDLLLASLVAWDIETKRKEPFLLGAKVVCVQFSAAPDTGWLVPIDHAETADMELTREARIELVRAVIELPGGPDLCGQNLKFDMNFVEECLGIHPRLPVFDTMIAHHMLFEEESKPGGNGLKMMAWKFTEMGGYERAVEEADPDFYEHMDTIPLETLLSYACGDTDATLQIESKLKPMIVEQGLEEVLRLEIEKQDFLKGMEKRGAAIDWKYRDYLMEALPAKSAKLRDRLRQFPEVGEATKGYNALKGKDMGEFNSNSTPQVKLLCLDILGLPPNHKFLTAKNDLSINKKVRAEWLAGLKEGSPAYEILDTITADKSTCQLHSFYVKRLPEFMGVDNRIHTKFNGARVVTYRLSSSDPNLQNLPRNDEDYEEGIDTGKGDIKRMYVAPHPGWLVGELDYAQIELRIAALISQDRLMLRCFREGVDMHRLLASRIFSNDPRLRIMVDAFLAGVPGTYDVKELGEALKKAIDKKTRNQAKSANFGWIYGISAETLSAQHNIPLNVAKRFIDEANELYVDFVKWARLRTRDVIRTGVSTSLFGHKRHLINARSSDRRVREENIRMGVNFPIQCTASNLCIYAGGIAAKMLAEMGFQAYIFGQVHDSLWVAAPAEEMAAAMAGIKVVMESMPYEWLYGTEELPLTVQIIAEAKVGLNLRDMVDVDPETPAGEKIISDLAVKNQTVSR